MKASGTVPALTVHRGVTGIYIYWFLHGGLSLATLRVEMKARRRPSRIISAPRVAAQSMIELAAGIRASVPGFTQLACVALLGHLSRSTALR